MLFRIKALEFQHAVLVQITAEHQISYAEARLKNPKFFLGDIINCPIESKSFGRIATQNAKNVILQKIREEERKVLYNDWYAMEKDIVQGVVQRYVGRNVSLNLGKVVHKGYRVCGGGS